MFGFLTTAKNKNAFILFEAILSVAILSFGLVLVLRSFSGSLEVVKISQNYFKATLLLEERAVFLESQGFVNQGISEGTFSGENEKFSWKISSSPREANVEEEEEERAPLNEVTLSVSWKDKEKIKSVSLVTYMKEGNE